MSDIQTVLYGASGYTGEHVMWKLAERGIPFIAAGRNKERLTRRLAEQPELKGARYEVVQVDHDEASMRELLRGKKVVHNLVGPYMQLGEPVVKAALAEGVHYLDATGEQDWILKLRKEYGPAFGEKGLVLAPACSSMFISGMLAAETVLTKPGIDSVDIMYTLAGVPSAASTLSFMRMCCQPQMHLVDNELEAWPPATNFRVSVPGQHQTLIALPWSGGAESIYFEDDPRVRNCSTLVAFTNQTLMGLLIPKMEEFAEKYAHLSPEEQEEATNSWASEIAPEGDMPREDFLKHRTLYSCHGRGTLVARSTATWGVTGYVKTGTMGAAAIDALLQDRQPVTGFCCALYVVGVQKMRAELLEAGVIGQMTEIIP